MSFLFGNPLYENYGEVTPESIDASEEAMRFVGGATSGSFAEIIAENTVTVSQLISSLYVADAMVECQVFENTITRESAMEIMEEGVKTVFSNIIGSIHKLWDRIKAWFKSIAQKIKDTRLSNVDFVTKYEKEILKKVEDMPRNRVAYKGYDYDFKALNEIGKAQAAVTKNLNDLIASSKDTNAGKEKTWETRLKSAGGMNKIPEFKFWGTSESPHDSLNETKEHARIAFHSGAETKEITYGDIQGNTIKTMIQYVKKEAEFKKTWDDSYKTTEKWVNTVIAAIEGAQKKINDKSKTGPNEKIGSYVTAIVGAMNSRLSDLASLNQLKVSFVGEFVQVSARVLRAIVSYKERNAKKATEESFTGEDLIHNILGTI